MIESDDRDAFGRLMPEEPQVCLRVISGALLLAMAISGTGLFALAHFFP